MSATSYRVLAATGHDELNAQLSRIADCEIVGVSKSRSNLRDDIIKYEPNIIIISDMLSGNEILIQLMITLKREFFTVRFIYLAGPLSLSNTSRVDALGTLVLSGIYDIYHESEVRVEVIEDLIQYPKTQKSVSYLTRRLLEHDGVGDKGLKIEVSQEEKSSAGIYENFFVVSSVKPGTGKSFVSSNLAACIAKYGKGQPRVALIEADLQTLSIGTILNIEDDKKNLLTALKSVKKLFTNNSFTGTKDEIREVNVEIEKCLIPYKGLPNLEVLTGSQIPPEIVTQENLLPEHFIYLIDALSSRYDVIIADMNSSIFHLTTYPLLQKARECFYILNLDFNNVRNNVKYRPTLDKLGVGDKIRYILNEDIDKKYYPNDAMGLQYEQLEFTADKIEGEFFKLSGKIPSIPKSMFLNRLYGGKPIILDNTPALNDARKGILEIANGIYEIEDYDKMMAKLTHKKKKGGFLFWKK